LLALQLEQPSFFNYDLIDGSTCVFLVAAISAPDLCTKQRDHVWSVNVTGTSEFISNVIGRGARVVFFSSDTVYGDQTTPFDESHYCVPLGAYAEMKHFIEREFENQPLFKTIRLSYVFSRDDRFTQYLRDCANQKQEAEVFHPFNRSVVHRDDVVDGALALALRWNEFPQASINFGGPNTISRIEFAETLRNFPPLSELRFRVVEPGQSFFMSRPRSIPMRSPTLPKLLGRPTRTIEQAASIEFGVLERI
jgi:dTDP-4-dehydrorhamnose reductase